MVPVVEQVGDIDVPVAALQQLDAFADGLHHPELDHVVDVLDEVAAAGAADVEETVSHGQVGEQLVDDLNTFSRSPYHEICAMASAGDAAARPGIDEVDPVALELRVTPARLLPVAVATIHDYVSGLELAGEPADHVVCRRTVGHVHQRHSWRIQGRRELLDGRDDMAASGFDGVGTARVVSDDVMALLECLDGERLAHPTEAADPESHAPSPVGARAPCRSPSPQ